MHVLLCRMKTRWLWLHASWVPAVCVRKRPALLVIKETVYHSIVGFRPRSLDQFGPRCGGHAPLIVTVTAPTAMIRACSQNNSFRHCLSWYRPFWVSPFCSLSGMSRAGAIEPGAGRDAKKGARTQAAQRI